MYKMTLKSREEYGRAHEYMSSNKTSFYFDEDYQFFHIVNDEDIIPAKEYILQGIGQEPLYNRASYKVEGVYRPFEVGMGASHFSGSAYMGGDRYPYTVIHIEYDENTLLPRHIVVRSDTSIVVSGSMRDGSAEYEYNMNNDGSMHILRYKNTKNRQGWETYGGSIYYIGYRSRYENPSF